MEKTWVEILLGEARVVQDSLFREIHEQRVSKTIDLAHNILEEAVEKAPPTSTTISASDDESSPLHNGGAGYAVANSLCT